MVKGRWLHTGPPTAGNACQPQAAPLRYQRLLPASWLNLIWSARPDRPRTCTFAVDIRAKPILLSATMKKALILVGKRVGKAV